MLSKTHKKLSSTQCQMLQFPLKNGKKQWNFLDIQYRTPPSLYAFFDLLFISQAKTILAADVQ